MHGDESAISTRRQHHWSSCPTSTAASYPKSMFWRLLRPRFGRTSRLLSIATAATLGDGGFQRAMI
jgi:hypothetical protein